MTVSVRCRMKSVWLRASTTAGCFPWAIFALSIGAISLLFMMIRDGAATQVASYMYLTPPVTALMAWALFAEPITLTTLLGTALTVVALWLVLRPGRMT